MSFCIICILRKSYRTPGPRQPTSGLPHPSLSDLTAELEASRRFSLNSLMALIAILVASGPGKALQPVVLTLLMYTITLHLSVNTCFLRNYPTFSRFLHIVPLLGTSCMAGVVLVSNSHSPAVAAVCLILGALPLVTIIIHHGRFCEASVAELPMQMQDMPRHGPASPGSVDTTLASD